MSGISKAFGSIIPDPLNFRFYDRNSLSSLTTLPPLPPKLAELEQKRQARSDAAESQDEDEIKRLKAQTYKEEYDYSVRMAFGSIDRDHRIELKRRAALLKKWETAERKPTDKEHADLQKDWDKMDNVFLNRKREILDAVTKNFEVKLLLAMGRSEAKTFMKELKSKSFAQIVCPLKIYFKSSTKLNSEATLVSLVSR